LGLESLSAQNDGCKKDIRTRIGKASAMFERLDKTRMVDEFQ